MTTERVPQAVPPYAAAWAAGQARLVEAALLRLLADDTQSRGGEPPARRELLG